MLPQTSTLVIALLSAVPLHFSAPATREPTYPCFRRLSYFSHYLLRFFKMVDGLINRPRSRTPPPYIPLQDPECEEHDVHALMYDIASRTESIFAQPTVYDILRLPEYKSWKEHIDNARALAAWLAPGPDQSCICEARRAKILTSEHSTLSIA